MPASAYRLPSDSANTGPRIRAFERTVTAEGTAQKENYFHLVQCEAAVLANVAASITSVTLQAANQQRAAWRVFNDSETATLYIKLGATASLTSFSHALPPKGSWALDVPYAGVIDGIWDIASGTARVTEVTP